MVVITTGNPPRPLIHPSSVVLSPTMMVMTTLIHPVHESDKSVMMADRNDVYCVQGKVGGMGLDIQQGVLVERGKAFSSKGHDNDIFCHS